MAYQDEGVELEDYLHSKRAREAANQLRDVVATYARLINTNYEAARNQTESGRPVHQTDNVGVR